MKKLLPAFLCISLMLSVAGCEKADSSGSVHGGKTNGRYFKVSIPDKVGFGCWGTPLSFIVDTNQKGWTVTADSSWCHCLVDTVLYSTFTLSLDTYRPGTENGGPAKYVDMRSCNVTVCCDSIFSQTFKVFQESETAIRIPQEPVFLSADGDTLDITVYNNCFSILAESSDSSWLKVRVKDNVTITLTSTPRAVTTQTPRQAEIRVMPQFSAGIYRITVKDADSNLGSDDYRYGEPTGWD